MKKLHTLALAAGFAFLSYVAASAEVRLPKLFSDHAVLQRDRPVHLWGSATPGAHVRLRFHGQQVTIDADRLGHWSAWLAPERAGGPYSLNISGDGPEITVSDLLVGDVWFASGQSNMEMPLNGFPPSAAVKNAEKEISAATNPRLRLLVAEHRSSDFPLQDVAGKWTECTPQTARTFSAVAYFFGRELAESEKVPIGLIDSTWGGTPADSWVSLGSLGSQPGLLPAFASRARFADEQADVQATVAAEQREDQEARVAGKPAPTHPWHPDETSWLPAGLYNGMVAPFAPYTIKGFLWYQGETNSAHDRAPYYGSLFSALIADWRSNFDQGLLPFLYVQISSFSSPGEDWGRVREEQRRTLAVANTAMVVSLDVGDPTNVHPADKQTVGFRLALAARALAYGESVEFSGPTYREATAKSLPNNSRGMQVWFDHAEDLTYRGEGGSSFELAGEDHRFVPAQAVVQGRSVLVTSTACPHPRYVRYGWASVVKDTLINRAGLPASTFTSERNPVN